MDLLGGGENNDAPSLENVGDEITDTTSDGFVSFEFLAEVSDLIDGRNFAPRVVIESPETRGMDVASVKNSLRYTYYLYRIWSQVSGSTAPNLNVTPKTRLKVFDEEGNMVGFDSNKGEYVVEIPGVKESEVSGHQAGREWITTPSNKSIRYELDTGPVNEFVKFLEEETNQTVEKTEFNLTFQLDTYTENTELNLDTGELENSVTREQKITTNVTKNESVSLGASAITDFDPDTLNKQDEGRWVNVTLKVPHEEIKVPDIDLTTVKLNQRVEPEMDEKFGFVRNPVENETFKAKFPRDEVADILDTGESVTVFITAETTKDELLTGKDKIRVIDRGRGVCPPGERVGPPDEVPGVGPDDGPGERVGPPEEIPSQANVSGCPSEEEGDSSEEEDDQIRRDRGRGDDSDMGTRHDRGRGDNYRRGGRGIPEGSRTRGR